MEAPIEQAIVLAAGCGARLSPHTDNLPTALVTVGDRPLVWYTLQALRRQGVRRFVLCRGWHGEKFDDQKEQLGADVTFLDCPRFATTGMLETLRLGASQLQPGGFYVAYGDIVFRASCARRLAECPSQLAVLVNSDVPGIQSKGFNDVEAVTVATSGNATGVRRIGKRRGVGEDAIAGEFGGLVKVGAGARATIDGAISRLFDSSEATVPWWMDPPTGCSVCDLLQMAVDGGAAVRAVVVSGGWHEVNTPHDLMRVRNDVAVFLSEDETRAQVAAMGACLLSEANDLKRPLEIVASELNIELEKLQQLCSGELDVGDALAIARRMSEVYPVPLGDLWMDMDDTTYGVRSCSLEASRLTSRVLTRLDRNLQQSSYYEYRDAAMTRCAPFRPEWIKQLRVVSDSRPDNPDVAMNNGHFMMQTTLFVGPVNFYYRDRQGRLVCEEMNTGDSNFITPFVPHSFTSRDESQEAYIVAVTFGGSVRKALTEFARVGAEQVATLTGSSVDLSSRRRCLLQRRVAAEALSAEQLSAASGISSDRVAALLEGAAPADVELQALAVALHVRTQDLLCTPVQDDEEVVVTRTSQTEAFARRWRTYVFVPLARTVHQPDLKTFDVRVLQSACPGEPISVGLHSFVYNFGARGVELRWTKSGVERSTELQPGDSAYIAPLVEHSFSVLGTALVPEPGTTSVVSDGFHKVEHAGAARLFVVRVPGSLTGETLGEFSTFSETGRMRVGRETMRWYN